MANIAISELNTETTSLGDDDYLLVSKNNGGSFTSAKMKGSVLKGSSGTTSGCNFSSDTVQSACQTAITNLNVTTSDNINTVIDNSISNAFINSTTINDIIAINSVKGNFIDWSQAFDLSSGTNRKFVTTNMPFDCIICWSTIPSTFNLNGVDVRAMLSAIGVKQIYVEHGADLDLMGYGTTSGTLWAVPISYGTSGLTYTNYTLNDFVYGGEHYEWLLDNVFDTMAVYASPSSTNMLSLQPITSQDNLNGTTAKYWQLRLVVKEGKTAIIGGGGKPKVNNLYTEKYYTAGHNIVSSSANPTAGNYTDKSGRKSVVSSTATLQKRVDICFVTYQKLSATVIDSACSNYNNITIDLLDNFIIS